MSFAQNVKKELIALNIDEYSLSELSALIKINGSLAFSNKGLKITVFTENPSIARRIFMLIKHFLNQTSQITIVKSSGFSRNQYQLSIINDVENVMKKIDISFTDELKYEDYNLIKDVEHKKAYLRGAFLASGSVNNPQTAKYHFEIKDSDYNHAEILSQMLNSLELNSKVIKRQNTYVVYIKEAEKIVECLAYMGAVNGLLFFENIRITRDVRNQANRVENCEQANYEKSYNAAQKQLHNIKIIEDEIGLGVLDSKYQLLCKYRRIFPEYSLSELADVMTEELDETFTKSKLNHWFRKINEKANIIEKNKQKQEG